MNKNRNPFPPMRYFGLANVMTTAVSICGLLAMMGMAQQRFVWAFTLYGAAILGDYADGMVARRLKQSSEFGKELDSLSDVISFCLLPAFCGFALGLTSLLGIAALLLYLAAGLWRLAYFNVNGLQEEGRHPYYTGVPTTIAASWLLILSPFLLAGSFPGRMVVLSVFFTVCGLLMVSAVPFRKNGMATKALYVLLPAAVALDWVLYK